MFTLHYPNGAPVLNRDGNPFRYSGRDTAKLGQRYLQGVTGVRLTIQAAE